MKIYLILLYFIVPLCYAESSLPDICADIEIDSQGIYECSKRKSIDADFMLNNKYKELNDKITSDYKSAPSLGVKLKDHIKKSQRAWITLRDENCAIESFVIIPGTSASETTKNFCIARESIERAHYLDNLKF